MPTSSPALHPPAPHARRATKGRSIRPSHVLSVLVPLLIILSTVFIVPRLAPHVRAVESSQALVPSAVQPKPSPNVVAPVHAQEHVATTSAPRSQEEAGGDKQVEPNPAVNADPSVKPKPGSNVFSSVNPNPVALSLAVAREIAADSDKELIYLPKADILLMTQAKGGTSSLLNWIYRGMTPGGARYNKTACDTIQAIDENCWGTNAKAAHNLPDDELLAVLSERKSTLRVAVQRDPYDRLLSCFKSKFACQAELYGTNLKARPLMTYFLRLRADMPIVEDKKSEHSCFNVSGFAHAVRASGTVALKKGDFKMRKLDVHYRPQLYHQRHIRYDLVLDLADLSNNVLMRPVWRRFPFAADVPDKVQQLHSSGEAKVNPPAEAERILREFAALSEVLPRKAVLEKREGLSDGEGKGQGDD